MHTIRVVTRHVPRAPLFYVMSTTSERIDKYYDDGLQLIEKKNDSKILTEVKKLAAFITKHQSDSVTSNQQSRLLSIIEMYYKYATSKERDADDDDTRMHDSVQSLISDLLALPEGKLVTSKGKKKAVTWLR